MTFALFLLLTAYPQKFADFFTVDDARVPAAVRKGDTCSAPGWKCVAQGVQHGKEYFAGRRWLPEGRVRNIYVESPTRVWIRTDGGVSRIEYRPMTLEQKAGYFEHRAQARHDREGFVASADLLRAGDVSSFRTFPTDNDGLWTAIYIGAEAFRYAATHSPEARARARRSMEAVMRLEQVTGIPGFPARAMIRKGEYRPADGVWRPSPDGQFEWKADTSSDELVGHFYAYAVYYDLVAEESEKPAIRAVVGRIARHLIEHDYALIDFTGKPTTWAQYSPTYLPAHPQEIALNSMLLLSHLLVAHHITGDARFREEYDKLIRVHGYDKLAARTIETREELNYSDEEMAMLGWYPLMLYEKDPALHRTYAQGLEEWWQNEKREHNPLWIYIRDACLGRRDDLHDAEMALANLPMDLIEWTVVNSDRPGLVWEKEPERNGARQTVTWLPPDERPVMKWNSNPFVVDGGNGGRSEDDGSFYLLPYWMGRYLGFLSR